MRLLFATAFLLASQCANALDQKTTEAIANVATAYVKSYGCLLKLEKKNIVAFNVDGTPEKKFVVLATVDDGCSMGSSMAESALIVVVPGTLNRFFVKPELSSPAVRNKALPPNTERIYVKNQKLWFDAKELDPAKDALCCPSSTVTSVVELRKGVWLKAVSKE